MIIFHGFVCSELQSVMKAFSAFHFACLFGIISAQYEYST